MRVPMFTALGWYLVCLRASSLDCRMAGVLSMFQFRLPSSKRSEDRWGEISYGVQSTAGGRGWSIAGGNGESLVFREVDF